MKKKTKKAVAVTKETPVVLVSRPHDLSLFCAKGDTAHALLHYNPKTRALEATNGKIAMRVPVDVQNMVGDYTLPEEFLIAPSDLMSCVKHSEDRVIVQTRDKIGKNDPTVVLLTGFATTTPVTHTLASPDGKFPHVDAVFEGVKDNSLHITLDARLLKAIATYALQYGYVEQVTFHFKAHQDKPNEADPDAPVGFDIPVRSDVRAEGVMLPRKRA